MKVIEKSRVKKHEQQLLQETSILSQIDHPNIVKLLEVYQDPECYYLISEFCSGGELFERLKKLNSFSEKMAANYIKQILSAIQYCH